MAAFISLCSSRLDLLGGGRRTLVDKVRIVVI